MAAKPAAPGRLDVIRRFVNTYDLEDHTDRVGTPEELTGWLAKRAFSSARERVGEDDVRHAAACAARSGSFSSPTSAVRSIPTRRRPWMPPRGGPAWAYASTATAGLAVEPEAKGVDGAIGQMLAIVAASIADGTWERLKACAADDCHWAFYDHTRNRSGRWCSMAVCGNRAKVERFRERARGGRTSRPAGRLPAPGPGRAGNPFITEEEGLAASKVVVPAPERGCLPGEC